MRAHRSPSSPIVLLACVAWIGCGGGGGSSDTSATTSPAEDTVETDVGAEEPVPTDPVGPTADLAVDAGYDRIVPEGASVSLNAMVDVAAESFSWAQVSGTSVNLDDADTVAPSFVAPFVGTTETLVFELVVSDAAGGAQSDRVSVEVWVPADGAAEPTAIADFTDRSGWQCDVDPIADPELVMTESDDLLTFDGNGIPAHATGTFPNSGNPNTIGANSSTYQVPLLPQWTGIATEMAEFGVTLDGVKLERDTAESYQNMGEWRYEAVTPGLALGSTAGAEFGWLGTDCNNAHVQPTGAYHYHGLPEGLINRLGEGDGTAVDMILGGYAADGFPIYLRYGYADPGDRDSGLATIEASWELRTGTRPSGPGGAFDGTFREDWEYVEGSGDLDECGGRFGPTPEYPDGVYHYYLTDDYPYIPRCVFGTPDASFRSMGDRP